jgi:hypothetical protein
MKKILCAMNVKRRYRMLNANNGTQCDGEDSTSNEIAHYIPKHLYGLPRSNTTGMDFFLFFYIPLFLCYVSWVSDPWIVPLCKLQI